MSKKLIGGLAAAALFMAAPALAHDGHGHRHGHSHGHGHGHGKHWNNHYVHERVVTREYWRPVPVYTQAVYPVYPAPAPGIHVLVPDIFIPFR